MAECPTVTPLRSKGCSQSTIQPVYEIRGNSVYKDGKFFALILAHNEKEKKLTIRIRHNPALRGKLEKDHTITTMYYN